MRNSITVCLERKCAIWYPIEEPYWCIDLDMAWQTASSASLTQINTILIR
jgi:hypothetical protein